ncbi:MFS transporter [Jannaschia seohaensis]|uniref:Uncharacterized protein n=1 Tax=Jannaschia seohaensis TaxID=475081 RepID=A0A2Y9C780_9RHOB|nr:MFS transporter [Jannaschia seohaensis]PWJ20567.1 hypothetical protein BCF38_103386 [Jannaschia seohaensis]SSA44663.1 hypothetical protein SAMN05421539_103386 [Jannaschia seohaensis]
MRGYSAVVGVGASAILVHPLLDPVAWFPLRFVLDFCFAAVIIVKESWLKRASPTPSGA